nr:MAG TPA: hypothetical protein [Microviridae sp.]
MKHRQFKTECLCMDLSGKKCLYTFAAESKKTKNYETSPI